VKNKGMSAHRLNREPLEKRFATLWEKENTRPNNGNGILDFLLAEDKCYPRGEVTDRDRTVAATVIQGLGSLVGQEFLGNVLQFDVQRHMYDQLKRG
jgi:hypothetical protein